LRTLVTAIDESFALTAAVTLACSSPVTEVSLDPPLPRSSSALDETLGEGELLAASAIADPARTNTPAATTPGRGQPDPLHHPDRFHRHAAPIISCTGLLRTLLMT
jgi:hypothetical protein